MPGRLLSRRPQPSGQPQVEKLYLDLLYRISLFWAACPVGTGLAQSHPRHSCRYFLLSERRTHAVASIMERVTDIVSEQLGVDKDKITARPLL